MRVFNPSLLIIALILLAPCSMDQYKHQPYIQIKADFSSAKLNRGHLNRSPDVDPDVYVPPFISGLKFEVFESGVELDDMEISHSLLDYPEDGFNSFEFTADYREGLSFRITAYSCPLLCVTPFGEEDITHLGLTKLSDQISYDGGLLRVKMKNNPGFLDPRPLEANPSFDFTNSGFTFGEDDLYCMDLSDSTYAIAKTTPEVSESNFNLDIKQLNSLLSSNFRSPASSAKDIRSCKFSGKTLYLPYTDQTNDYPVLIRADATTGRVENPIFLEPVGYRQPQDETPSIDVNENFAVLGFVNTGGQRYFKAYDKNFSNIASDAFDASEGNDEKSFVKFINNHGFFCIAHDSSVSTNDPDLKIAICSFTSVNGQIAYETAVLVTPPQIATNPDFLSIVTLDNQSRLYYGNSIGTLNVLSETLNSVEAQIGEPIKSSVANQKNPMAVEFGNSSYIVWADDETASSETPAYGGFNIYFSELGTDHKVIEPLLVSNFESGSMNGSYYQSFSPKIAINSDGLVLITWISQTGINSYNIYLRKFLLKQNLLEITP